MLPACLPSFSAQVSQAMATDLIMQSLAVPPAIRAFAQQKLATGSGWFVEESSNWTGFDLRLTIPFLMHRVFNVRQGEYVSYCSCCRRSLKGLAFEEARPCRGAKRELSTALPRVPRRCEDCAEGAITPYPASCSFCDDSDVAFHLRSRFGGGAMLSACKPCSARRPCFTLSSLSQTRSFHVSGSVIKDPGADGIWEEPEHWGFLTHPCVRTYTQLDSGYVAVKAFYLNSTLAFHAAVEPNEVAGLLHLLHDA